MGMSRICPNLALRMMRTARNGAAQCQPSGYSSFTPDMMQRSWSIWGRKGTFVSSQSSSGATGACRFPVRFHGTFDAIHCPVAGSMAPPRNLAAASGALVCTSRTFATKLKFPKVKPYSSYKLRFRKLENGLYKRPKAGKQHNAHSKSNKQQRQLRQPSVCPPGLAKAMKVLNFRQ